jgi:hypothetical protein
VDWDLIFARQFLENLHFRRKPTKAESYPITSNASSAPVLEGDGLESEWEILPHQPEMQVDGLVRFARTIRWPNVDRIESRLRSKLDRASKTRRIYLPYILTLCERRQALMQVVSIPRAP